MSLGQQALLLPTEEQETAHLESRRKRSEFMRKSSLVYSSVLEAMKFEYSAARAEGRARQTMRAQAENARMLLGRNANDCLM